MLFFVVVGGPHVVAGPENERLHEIDAEEAEQVDEGGDEREYGDDLGEVHDVKRRGGPDLLAPASQEEVDNGEEEGEEDGVREVQRERQGVGGLSADHHVVVFVHHFHLHGPGPSPLSGGGLHRRSPCDVHRMCLRGGDAKMRRRRSSGGERRRGQRGLSWAKLEI